NAKHTPVCCWSFTGPSRPCARRSTAIGAKTGNGRATVGASTGGLGRAVAHGIGAEKRRASSTGGRDREGWRERRASGGGAGGSELAHKGGGSASAVEVINARAAVVTAARTILMPSANANAWPPAWQPDRPAWRWDAFLVGTKGAPRARIAR